MALLLTGCASEAGVAGPGPPSVSGGQAAAAAAPVPCSSSMLRIAAGREGENGGAHGDIEFTDTSARRCVLRGLPRLAILRAGGTPLPVRLGREPGLSLSAVTLTPGGRDAADLVVFWANWCARPPGPLSVRVTLPAVGGVVTGPFNGPPDYGLVPGCTSPRQPSTVSVIDAYATVPSR